MNKRERNRGDLGGGSYSRKKSQEEIEQEERSKEIERLVAEREALKQQTFIERLRQQNADAKAKLEQPAQPEIKTAQPNAKHEVMHCNKWLIEQVLDKGKDIKTLVDEWLSIRTSKDFKEPPSNPLASMKTAIGEEKKRRNQG